MNEIRLLDKDTIDKIAAGEVIERPSSIVKELLENAIDAGALSVSIEIKNGGIDLIRVTDNGTGINKDQIEKAVTPHCTSKIENALDLSSIKTLGFRGEALSSISAVSRLEILTKTKDSVMGAIYKSEGGEKISLEDAGLPDGTTVIVRNLFFNVPARLKFLKSAKTEAGYVSEIIEKLALSNPDISFKFVNNGSLRLLTAGKGSLKDAIYNVFGREISSNLLEINASDDLIKIEGYIGKPEISRPARTLENYFVNGRYVKDKVIYKAIEDSYRGYQMKGSFPFCCLNIITEPSLTDVNVHPSKLEIKFFDLERVYQSINRIISDVLKSRENIPEFTVSSKQEKSQAFSGGYLYEFDKKEKNRTQAEESQAADTIEKAPDFINDTADLSENNPALNAGIPDKNSEEKVKKIPEPFEQIRNQKLFSDFERSYGKKAPEESYEQTSVYDNAFISQKALPEIKIVGQVFNTYWICEFENKMYIIDQHAAHEKVLYERFINQINEGEILSQRISPPVIVSLSMLEENTLKKYMDYFNKAGFEAEPFGGSEWAISAVPATLYSSIGSKELFMDILSELSLYSSSSKPEILLDRVATAACKAAVKGNNSMTQAEAKKLIESLLGLDNPYNCPHGRPTIITMSKYELEKKFKRII